MQFGKLKLQMVPSQKKLRLKVIVVMLWMSVTFAKFIAPIMPSLTFNPGGKHGLFVVQNLENIMGSCF